MTNTSPTTKTSIRDLCLPSALVLAALGMSTTGCEKGALSEVEADPDAAVKDTAGAGGKVGTGGSLAIDGAVGTGGALGTGGTTVTMPDAGPELGPVAASSTIILKSISAGYATACGASSSRAT